MNNYAVVLYFDEASHRRLSEMMEALVQCGVNAYMIDHQIPPHVTLSLFGCERIEPVIDRLEAHAATLAAGKIAWASLGAFVPRVLFAASVMSDYLLGLCRAVNDLLAPITIPGDEGHYLPNRWVPHAALAVRMTQPELSAAFEAASKRFAAFVGEANRLALVRCDPYTQIKTWHLPES